MLKALHIIIIIVIIIIIIIIIIVVIIIHYSSYSSALSHNQTIGSLHELHENRPVHHTRKIHHTIQGIGMLFTGTFQNNANKTCKLDLCYRRLHLLMVNT